MKTRNIPLCAVLAASTLSLADDFILVHLMGGSTDRVAVDTNKDRISLTDDSIRIASKAYSLAQVDSISFLYEEADPDAAMVHVTWNGSEAPSVTSTSSAISVTIDGGNVTLTNSDTTTEYTYILQGHCDNGSLTLVSDYKSTIRLSGLQLQSGLEEALNIKCGKRVALVVEEGTYNTLADATTDNGQKGAIHCKGHLELSGQGVLHLTGHIKHALSTKEYCQIKKSFGTLDIQGAASDGIHAGQYFQMNGGTLNIQGIAGDGIQAEATLAEDYDEALPDGSILIKGGTLSIATTGQDVSALQSDANLQIDGGTLSIQMSGAVSKALNSDADLLIQGGDITINNSGTGSTVNSDNETSKGLNANGNILLTGGNISIQMTGAGGKGIKADKDLTVGNSTTGLGPQLTVHTTGSSFGSSTTGGNTGGGGWRPGGGGRPGGGESSGGSSAKAMKCSGCYYQYGGDIYIETTADGAEGIESKNTTASAMNFQGGNLFMKVYDDCINSAGAINFTGANVICYSTGNDAIDSNYGKTNSIRQTAGVVISFSARGGSEMGIDADAMSRVTVTGGTLITGGGNQGGSSSSSLGTGSTHYKLWSGTVSYTSGRYYSIVCGDNIITWLMPVSLSSSYNAMASDAFTSSKTHYIYSHTSAPTSAQSEHVFRNSATAQPAPMLWIRSNVTTGTQAATFSPN